MKQEWAIAFDRAFELEAAPAPAPCSPFVAERFARHPDDSFLAEWQALAEDAAEPNSFQEPWFVAAGLDYLTGDSDIRLIEVRGDGPIGGLIGVMPLCVRDDYGRLPAAHVRNWRHHNDFLGTPLIRKGREADFWRALLDHLDRADWAPGFLHIDGLLEGGPVHQALAEVGAELARPVPVVKRRVRAALASSLSPELYLETNVRKKKRKELKRLANAWPRGQLSRRGTWSADEDLDSWCDDFLAWSAAVEREGRVGLASTGRPRLFSARRRPVPLLSNASRSGGSTLTASRSRC